MVIIPLSIFDIGSHMFFKAVSVLHSLCLGVAHLLQVQMVVSFVFWLCDMGVSFFSGFHELLGPLLHSRPLSPWGYLRRGRMEMRPAVIARNYMKTMFPLDAGAA